MLLASCAADNTPAQLTLDAGAKHDAAQNVAEDDAGTDPFARIEGGSATAQACGKSSDCTWAPKDCRACVLRSRAGVVALNRRWLASYDAPDCSLPCTQIMSPYLVPICRRGTCEVVDVRGETVSACQVDGDCQLRVRECCECGGGASVDAVIALPASSFSSYQALVCDDAAPVCDACRPTYPPTTGFGKIAVVKCTRGHCEATATYVDPL